MRKTKIEAQKTRQHLLDAALEVFWRNGVTRSSLQEIAQEAGVTRGALYWHFKNKEDLFDALFHCYFTPLVEPFDSDEAKASDNLWAHLRQSILGIFRRMAQDEKHQKFCNVLYMKCEASPANQAITELVEKYYEIGHGQIRSVMQLCHQRGLLPADTDLELSTLYLQSCVACLIGIWNCNPGQFDILPAAERILDTCFSALQNGALLQAKRSA
jgi:HTH-type transcriptional regulator mtrR